LRKFGAVKKLLNTARTKKIIEARKPWSVTLSVAVRCAQERVTKK